MRRSSWPRRQWLSERVQHHQERAAFAADAAFDRTVFAAACSFSHAAFSGPASFEHVTFAGRASFRPAKALRAWPAGWREEPVEDGWVTVLPA